MRYFTLLTFFAVLALSLQADEGDSVWARSYGGDNYDEAYTVTVDKNGYYVVAGFTNSYGSGLADYWILKIDPQVGDTIWTRTFGGSGNETARAVAVGRNGYYYVAGYTNSFGSGNSDFWVLKLDPSNGDTIWTRTYGGTGNEDATSIAIDGNGTFLVSGYTDSYGNGGADCWIVRLDPSTGDTLWTKTYGGSSSDYVNSITFDSEGKSVLAGYTKSFGAGDADFWILRVDPSTGDTLWTKTHGGTGSDKAYSVSSDSSGYLIVGYSNSFGGGDPDYFLMKVDPSTGDTIWTRVYGGNGSDLAYGGAVDSAGYYIVSGQSDSLSLIHI